MNLRRDLEASIDSSLGLDKQSVLLSHPQLSEFNNVVDFVSPSPYCCAFCQEIRVSSTNRVVDAIVLENFCRLLLPSPPLFKQLPLYQ